MAKPPRRLTRLARLGAMTSRVTTSYVRERVEGAFQSTDLRKKARRRLHLENAEHLADAMSHLKGAAMKVGQSMALAASSLELPEELQQKLAKLHNDAEPIPFDVIKEDVERSLGMKLSQAYADFDEVPLGTASLAQAHVARMHDGSEVVVKVLHRGIEDTVATDLLALKTMLVGSRVLRRDREELDDVFDEVKARLSEELDYLQEAANIHLFAKMWRGDDRVRIPEIHGSHCTERVLTMDRLPGRHITEFLVDATPEARQRAGVTLAQAYYRSAFRNLAVHADPHPGNYLFEDDGRVGILDFGCVKRFDEFWMGLYVKAALQCHAGDREGTLRSIRELGAWAGDDPEAGDLLWDFCTIIAEPIIAPEFRIGGPRDHIPELLKPIGKRMIRLPEIRVPREVIYLHRALGGMYTLGRKLQATFNWGEIFLENANYALARAEGRL